MIRWLRRREEAQGLVEFALMIPFFLILVFGIIDFGLGLRAYITVTQATREGARFAAVGNPKGTFTSGGAGECDGSTNTTVVGRVCTTINGLDLTNVQNVNVTYPAGQTPGESVVVTATYHYHYITPLRSIVYMMSGGSWNSYFTISSKTDMRLE